MLLRGYGPSAQRRPRGRPPEGGPGGGKAPDVLRMVAKHPEGIRVSEVATALGISHQLASLHLNRSFERGLIERADRGTYCSPGRANLVRESKLAEERALGAELIERYRAGQS